MNLLLNTHINSDPNHHAVHHQSRSIKYDDHDSDGAETKLEEGDTTWIPPEAADKEHDDDDDNMKWGSEPSPSPRAAERQRAMLKAMNGQLKVLVTRFLASAGISLPQQGQDGGESWLDIVTSLSWEAALLIKPHATVGKEMDPASYIKVKRVASGTRRQCEVIEGLVFKKNVAHKHMPTKCHNPKLLLLRGSLGDSHIGLSSFDSMEQEKGHMQKVIIQVMEICSPNVIMVEKTVPRDILELLLKEGVTLVHDMKLYQLERIARCSGSPIISFSDVLSKPKLKQCDYFHIEKFVEEHNHTAEAGKRSSKTLMFLEGFLNPLGCTLPPLHLHKQSAEDVCSPRVIVGPGGNVLCVAEDEISSIISCALAISDDRHHLLDAIVESEAADSSYSLPSQGSSSSSSSSWSSIGSSDSEANFSSDDLYSYDNSLSSPSLHPGISVSGRVALKGKYSVICVRANQFYTLRKECCPSELAYITSLSRCNKWDAQGRKSKASFAKTMDGRFIIKQINKTEFESFIEFAPDYFKHVNHSLDTGSPTCLAKILGIYQVKQIRNGKEVKIDLMVMENLLFGHNVSRVYDLKGAVYSRYVTDSSDRDTVYLDQNFVEDMRVSPIYIGARTKHLLQRAIWNDTSFLTSINVMDYSLLVGVDKENHEFVFGIIDYLRQYTWDKQLETWVKTSLVVPKNVLPTVISPREYKKRFRKFMAKYFLTVPDDWSRKNRTGSCKSCAHSNCKLPEVNNEKHQHQIETCA